MAVNRAVIDRIFRRLLLVAALLAGDAGAQLHAVPLNGASTVYEMERYSVLAPEGKDWFELKRDRQYAYFGKKIASPTHSFIATAIAASIGEKFANPEEFRDYVSRMLPTRSDERHSVLENRAEMDTTLGRFCVRYYTKGADRSALYAKGNTLFTETFGVNCLHPDNPGTSIDVSYTERGHPAEFSGALRDEGENFLRSLKFLAR